METAFELGHRTNRCAATGRELQAGEPFVAVLAVPPEDAGDGRDQLIRLDFSAEAWESGARPTRASAARGAGAGVGPGSGPEADRSGEPLSVFAKWRGRVPDRDARPRPLLEDAELLDLFLDTSPDGDDDGDAFALSADPAPAPAVGAAGDADSTATGGAGPGSGEAEPDDPDANEAGSSDPDAAEAGPADGAPRQVDRTTFRYLLALLLIRRRLLSFEDARPADARHGQAGWITVRVRGSADRSPIRVADPGLSDEQIADAALDFSRVMRVDLDGG